MTSAVKEKTLGRTYKEKVKKDLKEKIKSGSDFFIAHYTGLKSSEVTRLRRVLSKVGAKMSVVRNKLTSSVLEELKKNEIIKAVSGPTAFIFGQGDPVAVSKSLLNFAKENEKLQVDFAVIENKPLDKAAIKALSELPSREVLIAKLVGTIKAPLNGLHNALSGNLRKLVLALDAIAKKKQG